MSQVDYNEPSYSLEVSSQGFDSACVPKMNIFGCDLFLPDKYNILYIYSMAYFYIGLRS